MRQESQLDARASGTPVLASATTRTFTLKPHETKKLGVALDPEIGAAITAGQRARAESERARDRVLAGADARTQALWDRTFMTYFVDYLKPLPPGATAKKPEYIERPARMSAAPPPPVDPDPGARIVARGGTK